MLTAILRQAYPNLKYVVIVGGDQIIPSRRIVDEALYANERLYTDVPANTHPYISTGLHKHKFGVPIHRARELYAKASSTRHLKVAGVSVWSAVSSS